VTASARRPVNLFASIACQESLIFESYAVSIVAITFGAEMSRAVAPFWKGGEKPNNYGFAGATIAVCVTYLCFFQMNCNRKSDNRMYLNNS
jgi:hypothetical protein